MDLPILKRNYGGAVAVGAGALVTVYLNANPAGKVKKIRITGDGTNDCYASINSQGGTYLNLDYAATLNKRVLARLQPGYAALPAPGDVADVYNDFGPDVGNFTIHLLKTRGRVDEYVMIGTVAGTDPVPPSRIAEQGGDWEAFVLRADTVPNTTGYSLDPRRYFQVDGTWVQNNGLLVPSTEFREISAQVDETGQSGIETVCIYNAAGAGVNIRVESIEH